MIVLTRLDRQLIYFNPDHIVSIEETPDTVITLFNGNRYIVRERASTIISRIVTFRSRVIRRSEVPKKKYLLRQRRSLFQRASFEHESVCPDAGDDHHITPFHSRDL